MNGIVVCSFKRFCWYSEKILYKTTLVSGKLVSRVNNVNLVLVFTTSVLDLQQVLRVARMFKALDFSFRYTIYYFTRLKCYHIYS